MMLDVKRRPLVNMESDAVLSAKIMLCTEMERP